MESYISCSLFPPCLAMNWKRLHIMPRQAKENIVPFGNMPSQRAGTTLGFPTELHVSSPKFWTDITHRTTLRLLAAKDSCWVSQRLSPSTAPRKIRGSWRWSFLPRPQSRSRWAFQIKEQKGCISAVFFGTIYNDIMISFWKKKSHLFLSSGAQKKKTLLD